MRMLWCFLGGEGNDAIDEGVVELQSSRCGCRDGCRAEPYSTAKHHSIEIQDGFASMPIPMKAEHHSIS